MNKSIKHSFFLPVLAAVVSTVPTSRLPAQTNLYNFGGGLDGGDPQADLALIGNTLYGTTDSGGNSGQGTIFAINTDGSGFSTLYDFSGSDGGTPNRLVALGNTLYGTTYFGGTSGHGTVFSINTDGKGFQTLYSFNGTEDGASPQGANILSGNILYGTTYSGGTGGEGTIFKLNPNGTGFATLYSFTATTPNGSGVSTNGDGTGPGLCLILEVNTLYGTAYQGGSFGKGTVFKINTDGTAFTNLYTFTGAGDGANPWCDLILSGNTLYGTAWGGGNSGNGTVFSINTDGTAFTVLHRFSGNDGRNPSNAGLALSGNMLYGTTFAGGSSGKGTVFGVGTDDTGFTNLYSFTGSLGAGPVAGLTLSGNKLYGTTTGGDSVNGTIFSIPVPVTQPQLSITPSDSNVILTWPTSAVGFTLQSTTNLASPAWSSNLPAPVVVNGQNTVTNPISLSQQYYRLSK